MAGSATPPYIGRLAGERAQLGGLGRCERLFELTGGIGDNDGGAGKIDERRLAVGMLDADHQRGRLRPKTPAPARAVVFKPGRHRPRLGFRQHAGGNHAPVAVRLDRPALRCGDVRAACTQQQGQQ